MRIMFLTTSENPTDGYTVVGHNLYKNLKRNTDVVIDVYTSQEGNKILPNRQRLKSIHVLRFGWLAIIYDLFYLYAITRKKKYDLIHCNVEHFAAAAMLLSRITSIPFTVTGHGTYAVLLPTKMRVFKEAFKRADCVFCVSNYTRDRMIEELILAETKVIHNGVDTDIFKPNLQVKKENIITFVGNLKKRKGFTFLLEALKNVNNVNSSFHLLVIGRVGTLSKEVKNLISESGVDVKFTGAISLEELVRHYQKAKLNILASKSDPFYFEGFGLIHLEANACGTLTVGTEGSGNVEAILPGNGFVIKYGDVNRLSQIIEKTITNQNLKQIYPKQMHLRTWKQVAEEYADCFRFIVQQNSIARNL